MGDRPFAGRKLHFVGIGGVGMSGMALVTRTLGAEVSGSDRVSSSYTERLRAHGIEPQVGHAASNVPPRAEVVVSAAVPPENPELAAARAAGVRVLHRAELLAEIARLKRAIAVSGTHGKTTTCGMLVHALVDAARDPAYLIGGELRSTGTNAAWGHGDWVVVEADESDRSFLALPRELAVVTNVELDHHANYRSLSDLRTAFAEFTAPADVRILGPRVDLPGRGSSMTYGIETGDLRAEALQLGPRGSQFLVEGTPVELNVPGRHNVLNALAALAACRAAGLEPAAAAPGLALFSGTGRRFEERGRTPGGALVIDDYAHHPTEVAATLEAARGLAPRRLVVCFQPHLYSRTRELARSFGRALAMADVVVVIDVYPARERPEDFPGVSGLMVAAAAADRAGGRRVWWLPSMADAERMLLSELGDGDLLVTLGAGDIDRLAASLVEPAPAEAAR